MPSKRARPAAGLAAAAAGTLGVMWVRGRRRRYRRLGARLAPGDRAVLAGLFSEELLDSVRVATVPRIENPRGSGLLARLGLPPPDLTTMAAMALVDTVVMADRGWAPERRLSVLFHELVHIAQYRRLGTAAFLRRYARGWVLAGWDYASIPLERDAYDLQRAFDDGAELDVEAEVGRRLGARAGV